MTSGDQLKSLGLKATGPRMKILQLFEAANQSHLGADEIYRQLLAENEDVGLATVYRVLTQFEQAGILVRHRFDNDKSVYELNKGGHHDHLLCIQCGRVEEFYDPEIERRQKQIAAERGFVIHDHSLHLYVDCLKDDCPYKNAEVRKIHKE
jgi:Fur family transcriptional regulator, ferric uptake regulator